MLYTTKVRKWLLHSLLVIGLSLSELCGGIVGKTVLLAEITPDTSLGNESSQLIKGVEVKGQTGDRIEGGAVRGGNLFHSFSQFNIENGQKVYFTNPLGVENILTRITGSSRSEILGTLGVLGNANLFFINPNGILLGPNAQLDVAGSFVASTADSLIFDNGFEFSAIKPQAPSLLTINVPIGLQYNSHTGNIQIQGTHIVKQHGKTLAFVGGNVSIDNTTLLVPAGRVEMGGLTGTGTVGLNVNDGEISLKFANDLSLANVSLTNNSTVNVRAGGGGTITINAKNLEMSDSYLRAGISSGLGSTGSQAGDIEIHATENVKVDGISDISNDILAGGMGIGGNVKITSRSLSVTNGAQLSASTSGRGNAGSVTIQANDTVLFDGVGLDGLTTSAFSALDMGAVGKGGSINMTTGSLSVTNGAQLITRTNGRGDAGNVKITARNLVSFDGWSLLGDPENPFTINSGVFSRVNPRAVGNAGNIDITAESLKVSNGAQLTSTTNSQGDAGNVTIATHNLVSFDGVDIFGTPSGVFNRVNQRGVGKGGNLKITTGSLSVTQGAQLTASTNGRGAAGNINITARDRVIVDGESPFDEFPSTVLAIVLERGEGQGGNIELTARSLSITGGAAINASTFGRGDAGKVRINVSDSLSIDGNTSNGLNSSVIGYVAPAAVGKGGDIQIVAGSLTLNNRAAISAETASHTGGNIELQLQNLLLLRRNSQISATAGTANAGGDGGNITINAPFIVSVPSENNDITANAFSGNGGRVDITTQAIFGLTPRTRADLQRLLSTNDPTQLNPNLLSTSDITAISQVNPSFNGQVNIDNLDTDPSGGLIALPTNLVDVSGIIAQICSAGEGGIASQQSEFVVTGRGGLPANPIEPLNSDAIWQDLQPHALTGEKSPLPQKKARRVSQAPDVIEEAQGWMRDGDGTLVLVADTSAATAINSLENCKKVGNR